MKEEHCAPWDAYIISVARATKTGSGKRYVYSRAILALLQETGEEEEECGFMLDEANWADGISLWLVATRDGLVEETMTRTGKIFLAQYCDGMEEPHKEMVASIKVCIVSFWNNANNWYWKTATGNLHVLNQSDGHSFSRSCQLLERAAFFANQTQLAQLWPSFLKPLCLCNSLSTFPDHLCRWLITNPQLKKSAASSQKQFSLLFFVSSFPSRTRTSAMFSAALSTILTRRHLKECKCFRSYG